MKGILIPAVIFCLLFPAHGSDKPTGEGAGLSLILEQGLGITENESRLPGVSLAEGITQMTGVAISPLLGVAALGSWNYFQTPEENRHLLPWVCRPLFWGIGFAILGLIFLKDTLGTVLPSFIKKPLDLLELFEDKFSAIIAGSALVPFLVEQYTHHVPPGIAAAEPLPTATIPVLAVMNPIWILTPLALAGFFVVWIVSHTINVLIILSPFGFLDAILKVSRLCLLSFIGILYLLSPVLAALLALVVIAVCAYFAPSAFRLSFYGTVLSGDYLKSMIWKSQPTPGRLRCFLAKRGNKRLKVRTLGRVTTNDDGSAVFRSRRFFAGAWRSVKLPASGTLYVTNGFLFPTLQSVSHDTGKVETLLHLLPRYRHSAETVAEMLGVSFRETPALRGFTATKRWLIEFLRAGKGRAIEAAPASKNQLPT